MNHRTTQLIALLLTAALLLLPAGCSGQDVSPTAPAESIPVAPAVAPSDDPADAPAAEYPPAETTPLPEPVGEPEPAPEPEDSILTIETPDDIRTELETAIRTLQQPRVMDISAAGLSETPELDVKNLYYSLLSDDRSLCCAYDLTATVRDGQLTATVSYMPYRTGTYPEGFEGVPVASLAELVTVAEANHGAEMVNIRLTDTTLTPDDMNRALQQAGGGYLIYSLSRDATAIQCSPGGGFPMSDCLDKLDACEALAADVAAQLLTADMDEMAKARALYAYLTETVQYDQRYYTDKWNMPYQSQTAYGALQDGLAICGGYAHALKLLFAQAGLLCYNVSGTWGREPHMWNLARVDGEWLYFDATADRGVAAEHWRYCGVAADQLSSHSFDAPELPALTADGNA